MSRRLRTVGWILVGALPAAGLATACSGSSPAATGVPEPEAAAPVAETRWSERTELFMEYPPLVAGETSRFAVHFTNLARFEPVRTGRAEVRLSGADTQAFEVAGPDRPGYFGIDVTPARAGRYNLSVALDAGTLADRHELGEVEVLPAGTTPDGARRAAGRRVDSVPEGTAVDARHRHGPGRRAAGCRQPGDCGQRRAAGGRTGRRDNTNHRSPRRRSARLAGRRGRIARRCARGDHSRQRTRRGPAGAGAGRRGGAQLAGADARRPCARGAAGRRGRPAGTTPPGNPRVRVERRGAAGRRRATPCPARSDAHRAGGRRPATPASCCARRSAAWWPNPTPRPAPASRRAPGCSGSSPSIACMSRVRCRRRRSRASTA